MPISLEQKKSWMDSMIRPEENERFLKNGRDFIDEEKIFSQLSGAAAKEPSYIRDILQKSLAIERLEPEETAALLQVEDPELIHEMENAARAVKKKVYDNRIVTFAPLYCSNYCVNNCLYCGFRKDNGGEVRRRLTMNEVRKETEALVALGHKRLIVVYGEHPLSDADYMAETIRTIYDVKVPARYETGEIRRVNINAAPLGIDDYRKIGEAGIGTFQVFQETYHHETYKRMHPSGIKADYRWRLYALHRAMEAGIDDLAIGGLFGLYDWKFEVMSLLYHTIDLEETFGGIGPHTVSFPRLNQASGTEIPGTTQWKVSDEALRKLITVLRLSIPYSGMILTARETPELRRELIPLGITQIDCSSKIGIGAYSASDENQKLDEQQFMLGDTRSLNNVINEFADDNLIMSFCTAGYRCGRTGDKIMGLLKSGTEGKFCKLNAVLTYKEWLDDYGDEDTRRKGEAVIRHELAEIEADPRFQTGELIPTFQSLLERIRQGERDLYL